MHRAANKFGLCSKTLLIYRSYLCNVKADKTIISTDLKQDTFEYPAYTYSDIFSKYFFQDEADTTRVCPEYVLIFIVSGQLTVHCKCGMTTLNKGECIFLRKDADIMLERKSYGDEHFRSVFMGINRCLLTKIRPTIDLMNISKGCRSFKGNVIKPSKKPYLDSLYVSLLPYLQSNISPLKQIIEIKLIEAVYSLVLTDKRFYSFLFDFNKHEDKYSEVNCAPCDSSHLQSCYITQVIKSSYIVKQNGDEVADVYLDVTYKNVVRFLNAFDKGGLVFPPLN